MQTFLRIVFLLAKQKVSGGQEQEQVFVAMEFTVQDSNFWGLIGKNDSNQKSTFYARNYIINAEMMS